METINAVTDPAAGLAAAIEASRKTDSIVVVQCDSLPGAVTLLGQLWRGEHGEAIGHTTTNEGNVDVWGYDNSTQDSQVWRLLLT